MIASVVPMQDLPKIYLKYSSLRELWNTSQRSVLYFPLTKPPNERQSLKPSINNEEIESLSDFLHF